MSKMRVRLWCVAALGAASFVFAGGAALPVFASSHTDPDLSTPPSLLVGSAASFVAPAFGRGAPTCPSSDGSRITCYSPAFIQQAYDYPTGYNAPTGAGQTIVIVDPYGSPTIGDDVKAFDKAFGIAPLSLAIEAPNGSGDQSDPDASYWGAETSLDVEWAHAMAPGASIVLAVAPSDDAGDIAATEAAVLPKHPRAIVSESFGVDENDPDPETQAFITSLHTLYQSSPTDTVIASAGDGGATDDSDSIVAAYPASDPLVLGVGGTQGQPYPDGLWSPRGGYGGEAVWNESRQGTFYAATGGAPSILFPAPSWQRSFSHNSARTVPDVSYNAAIDGGIIVFDGPNVYTTGGTSVGPPQWAGIIALADQLRSRTGNAPLGDGADAALYGIAGNGSEYSNDFHDITQGNNILVDQSLGFQANRGYDLASGLGSPDVANLIGDLAHGSSQQIGRGDDNYFGNHNGSFGNGGRSHGGHISPAG
jgi:subtilase family serine protease